MNMPCENKRCPLAKQVATRAKGQQDDDEEFSSLRCSGCKFVFYCSSQCQKQAWKDHKVECKELAAHPECTTNMMRLKAIGHQTRTNRELATQLLEQARAHSVLSKTYKVRLPPELEIRGVMVNVVNSETNQQKRDEAAVGKVAEVKAKGLASALFFKPPEVQEEPLGFVFLRHDDPQLAGDPSMQDVRDLVQRYDPDKEFVMCLVLALADGVFHACEIVRPKPRAP